MAKQQTLTIVVGDDVEDPADLVTAALKSFLGEPPVNPVVEDIEEAFDDLKYRGYFIIEED